MQTDLPATANFHAIDQIRVHPNPTGDYNTNVPIKLGSPLTAAYVNRSNTFPNAISPATMETLGLRLGQLEPVLQIGTCLAKFRIRPLVLQGLVHPFNICGPFLAKDGIDPLPLKESTRVLGREVPMCFPNYPLTLPLILPSNDSCTLGITLLVTQKEVHLVKAHHVGTLDPQHRQIITLGVETPISSGINVLFCPNAASQLGLPHIIQEANANGTISVSVGSQEDSATSKGKHARTRWLQPLTTETGPPQDPRKGSTTAQDGSQTSTEPPPPHSEEVVTHEDSNRGIQQDPTKWSAQRFWIDKSPILWRDQGLRLEVIQMLLEFATNLVSHSIPPEPDATPLKMRHWLLNPTMEGPLWKRIDRWLTQGVVEEAGSSWSSPLVQVPKKINDEIQWAIDYLKLNTITKRDALPLPDIEPNLSRLSRSRVFSALDDADTSHTVLLNRTGREKTTPSSPFEPFQFVWMSSGLVSTPTTCSRLVAKGPQPISTTEAPCYLHHDAIHSLAPLIHCTAKEQHEAIPKMHIDTAINSVSRDLKPKILSAPIPAYPWFHGKPFISDIKVSVDPRTIGDVLPQERDKQAKGIAYGAHQLQPQERAHASTKGELLVVISFFRHFRYYLLQLPFVLRTDNCILTWIRSLESRTGMILRWLEILVSLDCKVEHRCRTRHMNVDALPRAPHALYPDEQEDGVGGRSERILVSFGTPVVVAISSTPGLIADEVTAGQRLGRNLADVRRWKGQPSTEGAKQLLSPDQHRWLALLPCLHQEPTSQLWVLRRDHQEESGTWLLIPISLCQEIIEATLQFAGQAGVTATSRFCNPRVAMLRMIPAVSRIAKERSKSSSKENKRSRSSNFVQVPQGLLGKPRTAPSSCDKSVQAGLGLVDQPTSPTLSLEAHRMGPGSGANPSPLIPGGEPLEGETEREKDKPEIKHLNKASVRTSKEIRDVKDVRRSHDLNLKGGQEPKRIRKFIETRQRRQTEVIKSERLEKEKVKNETNEGLTRLEAKTKRVVKTKKQESERPEPNGTEHLNFQTMAEERRLKEKLIQLIQEMRPNRYSEAKRNDSLDASGQEVSVRSTRKELITKKSDLKMRGESVLTKDTIGNGHEGTKSSPRGQTDVPSDVPRNHYTSVLKEEISDRSIRNDGKKGKMYFTVDVGSVRGNWRAPIVDSRSDFESKIKGLRNCHIEDLERIPKDSESDEIGAEASRLSEGSEVIKSVFPSKADAEAKVKMNNSSNAPSQENFLKSIGNYVRAKKITFTLGGTEDQDLTGRLQQEVFTKTGDMKTMTQSHFSSKVKKHCNRHGAELKRIPKDDELDLAPVKQVPSQNKRMIPENPDEETPPDLHFAESQDPMDFASTVTKKSPTLKEDADVSKSPLPPSSSCEENQVLSSSEPQSKAIQGRGEVAIPDVVKSRFPAGLNQLETIHKTENQINQINHLKEAVDFLPDAKDFHWEQKETKRSFQRKPFEEVVKEELAEVVKNHQGKSSTDIQTSLLKVASSGLSDAASLVEDSDKSANATQKNTSEAIKELNEAECQSTSSDIAEDIANGLSDIRPIEGEGTDVIDKRQMSRKLPVSPKLIPFQEVSYDHSDVEVRIGILKKELEHRKATVTKLGVAQTGEHQEEFRMQEEALKKRIGAYDHLIGKSQADILETNNQPLGIPPQFKSPERMEEVSNPEELTSYLVRVPTDDLIRTRNCAEDLTSSIVTLTATFHRNPSLFDNSS